MGKLPAAAHLRVDFDLHFTLMAKALHRLLADRVGE